MIGLKYLSCILSFTD